MITDFFPIPEVDGIYKTPSGEKLRVKTVNTDLGAIPDFVELVTMASPDGPILEYNANDWNALDLIKDDGSESTSEPQPAPAPSPSPTPTPEPAPVPTPDPVLDSEPVLSDGLYSSDPYINEVAKLLDAGPTQFNQGFFPTDKDLSDNNMVEKDVEDAFQKTLDEITKLREEGNKRKAGFFNEFLWTCGGLDKPLLRMCPVDWAKKTGMGGTILGTAVLASFSGGFAAYTVFENFLASVVAGIIWGLVIFNLDRYLVNSMYSDGKASISWPELRSGLPRILIAFFIGVVIATPIELKIFEGKINAYIDEEGKEYLNRNKNRDLTDFNTTANRLKKDYDNASKELTVLQKCIVAEEQGLLYDRSNGDILKDNNNHPLKNPRGAGNGDEYKALKQMEKPLKQRVDSLKKLYDNHMKKEDNLIVSSNSNARNQLKNQLGLSKKLEVMSKITEKDNALFWTRVFISLFFIILEVLPVFSKMMQQDGKYDKLVDLESDTMDKLSRIKEFNNINVLRSGHLSIYRAQILGHSIIDEENEGNNAFFKQDRKKQNKDETDADNQDIYRKARSEVKKYILTKIEGIFNDNPRPQNGQVNNVEKTSLPIDNSFKPQDASDEAETI